MNPSTVASRFTVPFGALGLPDGESPPKRFVLQVASRADVERIAGGVVRVAETFHYDDPDAAQRSAKGTVAGGLFCEHVFGPLPRDVDLLCALDPRSKVPLAQRPQAGLLGCIELAEPVLSPWCVRFAPPGTTPSSLARLPVLAPAMRPLFRAGERVVRSDLNDLYAIVINRSRRLARLVELNAPPLLVENEQRLLENAVFGLLVDGATIFAAEPMEGDDDPDPEEIVSDPEEIAARIEEGARPKRRLLSLHEHMLQREPARFFRWLDAELNDNPGVLSAEQWPHDVHLWRAFLEAACLEIVPLREDGSPDLELLERARIDRSVQITHKVHDLVLGEGLGVLHPDDGPPHIDVYAHRHAEGVLMVTGTATGRPGPREFACLVDDATDEPSRVAVMRRLGRLAFHAASGGRELALRHTVDMGGPLAPGSALSGFVLLDGSARLGSGLRDLLPHHPDILLAVGVTPDELAHARARGAAGAFELAEAAERRLLGRTRLGRTEPLVGSG